METHTASSLMQVHSAQSEAAHSGGLLNAIKSATRAIVRWHRQRRDVMELQRMDDRLLADIGITRSEAENMVRNGRWGQAAFEPDAALPATDRKRSSILVRDKGFGERA